ncbi:Rieske 2Fe-2S family protein [Tenacibaculum sp. MAR_2010_89]|uniref:aromatic ring-hydroxylating oxygenase subunit alpha n=1 Tax=Tenacibaculum sp. MAR_2010_89 TaxID=1250198 RepID=UPI000895B668|nr:aromatic ring-hydroxylating dioxygenase subunit alpha [Tenacibaculum sp. MAR_2010_89]SEE59436.1 Rieske 2Fe-2S family protein [Tenacibaculum sp. MAR_2010_89]
MKRFGEGLSINNMSRSMDSQQKKMMHVLPVEAYTSKEWFDLEMKTLFSTTWQFAGLVEDVANPGDYIAVQAGLNNIFIVKGRDHRLRAFHNMCRHRGTQLLRAVGENQKAITCPYHDWTYDLEGKLISVPKKEEEFPYLCSKKLHECDLNLHEASVDIFKGMLFVHPEKNAQNILEFFGEVTPYLGPHIPEELVEYQEKEGEAFYTKEIHANWKIIVENYIDHYHLAHLHEGTLNMYDHAKAEFGWKGPHYWFYEPLVTEYLADVDNASPQPLISSVPREKIGAYVPWLFPNIGITEGEAAWNTFHAIPLAADKTLVVIRSKMENASEWEFTKQYTRSSMSKVWLKYGNKGKYEGDPSDPMASGDFMKEDVYACEQQQKSLKSPMFSLGARAKRGEYAVMRFQEEVKKWMNNHGANV